MYTLHVKLLERYSIITGEVCFYGSLIPRPCTFVACSTKFMQRAWACSSRDVCSSLRHGNSLRINDVIGWASVAFYVERGSQRSQ